MVVHALLLAIRCRAGTLCGTLCRSCGRGCGHTRACARPRPRPHACACAGACARARAFAVVLLRLRLLAALVRGLRAYRALALARGLGRSGLRGGAPGLLRARGVGGGVAPAVPKPVPAAALSA